MTSVADSYFARALRVLARLICRHPAWFILPQILLLGGCVFYTVKYLQFDMDQDNLVGSDKKYNQVYLKFEQEFPGGDEMAVVVESEDPDRNRQFVERLAAKMAPETNLFTDILYKNDLPSLGPKALLFLSKSDMTEMLEKLREYRPFIEEFTEATNLDSFFGLINRQFRTAKAEENASNNAMIGALPALQRIVEEATDSLARPNRPVSPGVTALFGAGDEAQKRMYITYESNRIYLVTARPRSDDVVPEAIHRMRQLMEQTEEEVPGLNVGLTGKPVLDFDQGRQSQIDSTIATIVSLVICSLIFIYAYREIRRPLKAVICLIVGLGYSMGFTTLAVGHLNILTITFAPILIGLAIDFGIHFITRYEEETRHGRSPVEAIEKSMVFTGQGIVTGALTTAFAFLAMGLTNFKGVQEMGIIAGGGLVFCLIPMMTMLPALLLRGRQTVTGHAVGLPEEKRERIERFWLDRPGLVIGTVLVLCGLAAASFKNVRFDYNLLHMQSKGLPAVEYDLKLANSGQSIIYCAIMADSVEQARQFEKLVVHLPAVAEVDGSDEGEPMFERLTQDQSAKLQLVQAIKSEASSLHFAPVDTRPINLDSLNETLWATMGYLGLATEEVQKERPDLARQLNNLRQAIIDLRVTMMAPDPTIAKRLQEYQTALFDDIRQTFESLQTQDVSSRLRPEDLPPALRNQFIGVTGKCQVQVWPKADIWNHENQHELISEIRQALDGNADKVTGTPVQLYEYTSLLKDSYEQAALYALIAIVIMVFLHFRSVVCVILSLLPVVIGAIWTVGLMSVTGIQFNPANIMTLPLVIGIGVTNGIHILNRVAEEHKATILSKSTGKAVLVSGLTAITGFGSLSLGKHQGIRSLGIVMATGIAACMIAGLTFLPAVINLLGRWGWSLTKRRPGSGNAEPPPGLEEPR